MNQDYEHSEAKDNAKEQRYEVRVGHEVAELTYKREPGRITFLHTGVPASMEGHGIGSKLAHTALEEARAAELKVVPLCSFMAGYIEKHPEYESLL